jgi:hypothetical protein
MPATFALIMLAETPAGDVQHYRVVRAQFYAFRNAIVAVQ